VLLFALRRYFVLTGTVLRYYKSERDAALNPRGVVDVQVSGQCTCPHGKFVAHPHATRMLRLHSHLHSQAA
jgi:hypothetical protein